MKSPEEILDIEYSKNGLFIHTISEHKINKIIVGAMKEYANQFKFIRTTSGELLIFDDADYVFLRNHTLFLDAQRKIVMTTVKQYNNKSQHVACPIAKLMFNLEYQGKAIIKYKNKNPLDLRRENIDVATHRNAICGKKIQSNNTSGYKGVSWNNNAKKYGASIRIEGKSNHLGYFSSSHDAALAYNKKAEEVFGKEYAWLNKISWNEKIQ